MPISPVYDPGLAGDLSNLPQVPGIFISRLVPGGLAESTGLLAVNDEVLEVNGIEVAGKTLDQVSENYLFCGMRPFCSCFLCIWLCGTKHQCGCLNGDG